MQVICKLYVNYMYIIRKEYVKIMYYQNLTDKNDIIEVGMYLLKAAICSSLKKLLSCTFISSSPSSSASS